MRDISVHVSLALPGDGEKKWRKISLIKHRFGECAAGGGIVDEDEKRNAANHSLLELCSVHVNGRTFRNRTEVAKFIQRMLLASDHVFDIDVDTEEDGVVGQKEPIPFHIISLGKHHLSSRLNNTKSSAPGDDDGPKLFLSFDAVARECECTMCCSRRIVVEAPPSQRKEACLRVGPFCGTSNQVTDRSHSHHEMDPCSEGDSSLHSSTVIPNGYVTQIMCETCKAMCLSGSSERSDVSLSSEMSTTTTRQSRSPHPSCLFFRCAPNASISRWRSARLRSVRHVIKMQEQQLKFRYDVNCMTTDRTAAGENDSPPMTTERLTLHFREEMPPCMNSDQIKLLEKIGSGTTGEVYRATIDGQLLVAVKIVNFVWRGTVESHEVEAFKVELKALSKISHPNIVRLYGVCIDDSAGGMMLIEELVNGLSTPSDLRELLHRKKIELTYEQKIQILLDIAYACEYLTSINIVHGDISPGNILVSPTFSAKLCDFGVSWMFNARRAPWGMITNREGRMKRTPRTSRSPRAILGAGAPAYASPEVLRGLVPSEASDVFSFGTVCYELLTEQQPWQDCSVLQVSSTVLAGGRPPLPASRESSRSSPFISQYMSDLISLTWENDHRRRPDFSQITSSLQQELALTTR